MSKQKFDYQVSIIKVTGLPPKLVEGGQLYVQWKRGTKKGNQGETGKVQVPKNTNGSFDIFQKFNFSITLKFQKGAYEKKDLSLVLCVVSDKGKSGNLAKASLFLNKFKEGNNIENVSFFVKGSKQPTQVEISVVVKKVDGIKSATDSDSESESKSTTDDLSMLEVTEETSKIESSRSDSKKKAFGSESNLESGTMSSPRLAKIACPKCPKTFRTNDALEMHLTWDHTDEPEPPKPVVSPEVASTAPDPVPEPSPRLTETDTPTKKPTKTIKKDWRGSMKKEKEKKPEKEKEKQKEKKPEKEKEKKPDKEKKPEKEKPKDKSKFGSVSGKTKDTKPAIPFRESEPVNTPPQASDNPFEDVAEPGVGNPFDSQPPKDTIPAPNQNQPKSSPGVGNPFGDDDDGVGNPFAESNATKERLEREKIDRERLEREKLERMEKEKVEAQKREKERIEKERLQREKEERERLQRIEKEKIERYEQEQREKQEAARLERDKKLKAEKEKAEKEKLEAEREKAKLEREKQERETRAKMDSKQREKLEKERLEKEKQEKEKQAKAEKERTERSEREKRDRREKEEREAREALERAKQVNKNQQQQESEEIFTLQLELEKSKSNTSQLTAQLGSKDKQIEKLKQTLMEKNKNETNELKAEIQQLKRKLEESKNAAVGVALLEDQEQQDRIVVERDEYKTILERLALSSPQYNPNGENIDAILFARYFENNEIEKKASSKIDFLNLVLNSLFAMYNRYPDNLPLLFSSLAWVASFYDALCELIGEVPEDLTCDTRNNPLTLQFRTFGEAEKFYKKYQFGQTPWISEDESEPLDEFLHVLDTFMSHLYVLVIKAFDQELARHSFPGCVIESQKVGKNTIPQDTSEMDKIVDIISSAWSQAFSIHRLGKEVCSQLFEQIFFFMSGKIFNYFVSGAKKATATRAYHVKLNLSKVEQWASKDPSTKDLLPVIRKSFRHSFDGATALLLDKNIFSSPDMKSIFPSLSIAQLNQLILQFQEDEFAPNPVSPTISNLFKDLMRSEKNKEYLIDLDVLTQ